MDAVHNLLGGFAAAFNEPSGSRPAASSRARRSSIASASSAGESRDTVRAVLAMRTRGAQGTDAPYQNGTSGAQGRPR